MAEKKDSKALTNSVIAELLALEAKKAKAPMVAKALRKASRLAFTWQIEAVDLLKGSRPFSELEGVGPFISKILESWFEESPSIPERDETRTGFITLTEARSILKTKPAWKASYRGDLQMHTRWSDGSATVAEMAEAAIARGYSYIGITDHSKGLKIAGGIDESDVAAQAAEIDSVNASLKSSGRNFTVLKSLELNLNPAGEGDMDESSLRHLDVVVGSFHSALRKREDQTARYLAALENPCVHILGHPRGRIYNYRLGLTADWERVFGRAAELGKAVEIDSYPDRQDLSIDLLSIARRAGCPIAIDTDAHHPWQLDFVEYGLAAALKAGIDRRRIINFLEPSQLVMLFQRAKPIKSRGSV